MRRGGGEVLASRIIYTPHDPKGSADFYFLSFFIFILLVFVVLFHYYYRKPFGGAADPVNDLDPIQTLFWPEGIGSENS